MKKVFYFLILIIASSVFLVAQDGDVEKKTPEDILLEREDKLKEGDIKGLLSLAVYARNNRLKEDAERLYSEVLSIDPFNKKAHKGLGHVLLYEVWVTKEEKKEFNRLLKEEKKDPVIRQIKKMVFDNNTQVGRDALKKLADASEALSIDIAYKMIYRSNDVFMVDIAIDIFHTWCGDKGRDIWIKRIARSREVGETIHCLEVLKDNLNDREGDPLTKFLIKELYSGRNENISLKVIELLSQIQTDEVKEAMTKYLPRCNNQNVKQKLMEALY